MELQLKNIGMIKEANVKINGLTVIAGENDTGKSTVGRKVFRESKNVLLRIPPKDLLFEKGENISSPILINTPEFLSDFKLFNKIIELEEELQQSEIDFSIEELSLSAENMELLLLLAETNKLKENDIYLMIKNIINGTVYYDDKYKDIFFKKNDVGQAFFMNKTSSGIKMFGFFQILILNGSIKEGTVLILDEPEVHLHPKWQLEMAKIIVKLVKNGVKILVNSHSPYMIEALQRYSELAKVNSDFYLAEDGYINKVNDSNSETLSKIFEKLSEPFDVFEKMESQKMENFING